METTTTPTGPPAQVLDAGIRNRDRGHTGRASSPVPPARNPPAAATSLVRGENMLRVWEAHIAMEGHADHFLLHISRSGAHATIPEIVSVRGQPLHDSRIASVGP